MLFQFNKYSSLLLIFFVHGLVYAFLLFRKSIKNETTHDKWLGLFLVLCSLYICPWMLGFAGWYDGEVCMECRNFLFYMPFQQALLMGPVIYFYLQSLLNPSFKFGKREWLQLVPSILYNTWIVVVAITDRLILKTYFFMNGQNDPDFDSWYIALSLISLLTYLVLSFKYYQRYKNIIYQELSFADDVTYKWIRNFLIAFFIYFFSSLIIGLLDVFNAGFGYTGTWWYYLLFAIIYYYIAITGYSNSIVTKANYQLAFLQYKMPPLLGTSLPTETVTQDIDFEEISEEKNKQATKEEQGPKEEQETNSKVLAAWKTKVLTAIVTDKMYQNPELTLTDLSKHLSTNPSLLSKIINQGFEMNFNDLINYYRVEDVKLQLQNTANAHLTIMSLAYDAGFNSKATFNRAFKKVTGKSPKEYMVLTTEDKS
jgi:AraC-like DNA-binding protein